VLYGVKRWGIIVASYDSPYRRSELVSLQLNDCGYNKTDLPLKIIIRSKADQEAINMQIKPSPPQKVREIIEDRIEITRNEDRLLIRGIKKNNGDIY
jgi:hypothetical protein